MTCEIVVRLDFIGITMCDNLPVFYQASDDTFLNIMFGVRLRWNLANINVIEYRFTLRPTVYTLNAVRKLLSFVL